MKKVISLVFLTLFFLALPVWLGIVLMPKKSGLNFQITTYSALDGWQSDDQSAALKAFLKSCELILKRQASKPMPQAFIAGTNGDWHPACQAASELKADGKSAARNYFEQYFTPLEVYYNGHSEGTFTGYHEPLLKGSLTKTERYTVPLFKKPANMIKVDLGDFNQKYKGISLRGTLSGDHLVPYANRANIVDGALNEQNLELLWVDSEVDAFFVQVQGSGRVQLDDGSIIGVGYAEKNGQPYRSLGRILIDAGELTLEGTSAQSIKAWLHDNPERQRWLLDQNPSYVFFRMLEKADGPYGSAGVTLTAERSLAVDPMHLPLLAPIWVDASHPDQNDKTIQNIPFQRLMIAQDTGGAIKGAVRGDVFWGYGAKADEIAGRMNNKGRLVLLLPNALANMAANR